MIKNRKIKRDSGLTAWMMSRKSGSIIYSISVWSTPEEPRQYTAIKIKQARKQLKFAIAEASEP